MHGKAGAAWPKAVINNIVAQKLGCLVRNSGSEAVRGNGARPHTTG